jgi:large subunit ribosomal protein L25
MAAQTGLKADRRVALGKQMAKRLRKDGLVPAVMYRGAQAFPCSVNLKEFETLVHREGRNVLVSLNLDGEHTTIIKEIQHHPVKGGILHVDFHEISLTDKVVLEVPVVAVGTALGVRQDGGILEHRLYRVEVECLPTQIPDRIEVDVTNLAIGDSVHVSDLKVAADVRIVTDPERSVFSVVPPTVLKSVVEVEAEAAVAEAAPTEPEVIERGKKTDEEEA